MIERRREMTGERLQVVRPDLERCVAVGAARAVGRHLSISGGREVVNLIVSGLPSAPKAVDEEDRGS